MRGVPTRSHYQPHYLERVWYAQVKGTTCWQPPLQREGSAVPRGRLGSERGRGRAAARQQQRLWPAPSRSARSPARHWHGGGHPPASRATSSTAGGDPRSSVKSPLPIGCTCKAARGPRCPGTFSGWLPGGGDAVRSWAPQQFLGCSPVCAPRGASSGPWRRRLHAGSPSLPPWLCPMSSLRNAAWNNRAGRFLVSFLDDAELRCGLGQRTRVPRCVEEADLLETIKKSPSVPALAAEAVTKKGSDPGWQLF